MARYSAPTAAAYWLLENSAFYGLRLQRIQSEIMRYEDLVRDPWPEARRLIGRLLNEYNDEATRELVEPAHYEARRFHTIGGSRIRFKRGSVEIREDDEWRTAMTRRNRYVVTALTLPLLAAYGYM